MAKKLNPMLLYSLVNKGVNIISEPIQNYLGGILKSRCIYTLDLSSLVWGIETEAILESFPHLPRRQMLTAYASTNRQKPSAAVYDRMPSSNIDIIKEDLPFTDNTNAYDLTFFNGTPIICAFYVTRTDSSSERKLTLSTFRSEKGIRNIRQFAASIRKRSREIADQKSRISWRVVTFPRQWTDREDRPYRTFKDVFIPKYQEDLLLKSVKGFINKREWYEKSFIPYHYGILLHGNPGTGKSSIIQALINEIDCDVIYAPSGHLNDFIDTGDIVFGDPSDNARTKICIIEDVDTSVFTKTRKPTGSKDVTIESLIKENESAKLGELLNIMDGIGSQTNVIWILTTNHIEQLDPALIRPGRIDLKLEIGYVTDETFDRFMTYHFGKGLPDGKHVIDNLIFAQLQNEIMFERSYEYIIENFTKGEISHADT